ncbi:hypothetical protein QBC37DRAFT_379229 [Rhypophila decipiens]|uniref:RING-type domain-containing protein n=1 Tax=Rhypophila decipiens TaxID=261697 RepID=A0AAN7B2A6_9PEZI|nr:hypothetical protein QBC37DRAFT_379229 [Rhypophila decipiens]
MFCCICYENELFIHRAQAYKYKPDAEYAMLLPCGHILGHVCLQAWKEDCQTNENPYTCPVCRLELEPPRCPRHKVPEAINLARPLPSSSRTRLWLRNFIVSGDEPERTPNQYPTEGDKYKGKFSKDCHYCFEERRPDWKAQYEADCKEWIAKGFFSPWSPEQVESDWAHRLRARPRR